MGMLYIFITIIALGIIFGITVWKKREGLKRLSTLGALAFGFVIAGVVFSGDSRLPGYALMGIGVILAVVDIFINKNQTNV